MFFLESADAESRWKRGPSDEVIAARVIAGETRLFEVLMRRHNQRLYRALRGLLKDETEIEDIMQQTYVDAFANLRQLRGPASLSSWLVRIAMNEALARLRRKSRFEADPIGCGDPQAAIAGAIKEGAENPEERAWRVEQSRLLQAAVDELPARYRVVFLLREVEEMSTRETAFSLEVSEDVVKTRLRRSKLLIRRTLGSRISRVKSGAFAFHATRCNRVVKTVLPRIAGWGAALSGGSLPELGSPWRH